MASSIKLGIWIANAYNLLSTYLEKLQCI